MKGRISEIFDSIQGEGLYLGEKQVFVRFYGCNLGCAFCDTKPDSFMEYEPEEVLKEILMYGDKYHSVSFTGGEPLLQKDFLKEILKLTRKANYKNYLETNGTLYEELGDVIEYLSYIAMDLKLPSSTGQKESWDAHRSFLKVAGHCEVFLKAVITRATKEDDLRTGLRLIREIAKGAVLVLQPDSRENKIYLHDKLESFKELCRKEKVTTCVVEQVHKVIGVR
jgi:organic radical activating enzyme